MTNGQMYSSGSNSTGVQKKGYFKVWQQGKDIVTLKNEEEEGKGMKLENY